MYHKQCWRVGSLNVSIGDSIGVGQLINSSEFINKNESYGTLNNIQLHWTVCLLPCWLRILKTTVPTNLQNTSLRNSKAWSALATDLSVFFHLGMLLILFLNETKIFKVLIQRILDACSDTTLIWGFLVNAETDTKSSLIRGILWTKWSYYKKKATKKKIRNNRFKSEESRFQLKNGERVRCFF